MDCLVAVPVGWDSRSGPLSGHMPSAAAMQALAAHMPAACAVGSPTMRGTMFLPRLCSIPETEAECDVASGAAATAGKLQETSCVRSAEACRQASVDSSSTTEQPQGQDCSSSPCSCCSSHEATTSAEVGALLEGDDAATADLPAVVASTWAISIRHFTDCVPISTDSVCSNSTCHATQPAAAASSASARQQQQQQPRQATGQQQQGCSSAPRTSSSSSSLSPAAEDDGGGQDYSLPLSGSLSLSDMDALEWQPWDRVAKWLELNGGATGAAAAAATPAAAPAAPAKERPSSSSRSVRDAASPHPGHTASSAGAAASSHSRPEQPGSQEEQEQEQQQGGGEQEALFDAPDWWQESVKARLEEQREAFHSSWFARLKISLGLAAQRASH